MDGGYEVALPDRHGEIDGVEVDFASETAAEIRTRVHGRTDLLTAGTQEYELALAEFVRPPQFLQEGFPANVVPQATQEFVGEVARHDVLRVSGQLEFAGHLLKQFVVDPPDFAGGGLE
jgi:hypothetical protein